MADNVTSNPGSGGVVWRTTDVGGVHHPWSRVTFDVSGTPTLVAASAPLPIRLSDGSAVLSLATGDMDTGAPTDTRVLFGIALPGAGGAVVGGTSSDPIRIDPTGTTSQPVAGAAAADNPVSGGPVFVGFRASATEPAQVSADGDAVGAWGDREGRQVTIGNHPAAVAGSSHGPTGGSISSSGDNTAIAAPGSGSLYITGLHLSNADAAAQVTASIKDGAGSTCGQFELGPTGGNTGWVSFNPPWKLSATTAFIINLSAARVVKWTAHFFTAP